MLVNLLTVNARFHSHDTFYEIGTILQKIFISMTSLKFVIFVYIQRILLHLCYLRVVGLYRGVWDSHSRFGSTSDDGGSDSDFDEINWTKHKFPSVTVDLDAIKVCPKQVFMPTDGPVDFFCKFFDEDVFSMLVQQTNLYAKQSKIRHWNDTSVDKMHAFIAALIGMGLYEVPNANMY